jgi:methylglutaconyl-CoA hydratase
VAEEPLRETVDETGCVWLTLARVHVHNAFDERLIAALTAALTRLADDSACPAVVLAAEGRSFSAGADLDWMRRQGAASFADNVADAMALAELLRVLDELPKPTLAVVQGAAYGGGVGLVACCDVAIAAQTAKFAMTEVRLGLIPAVISPHVLAAIGARAARRYFLTGEAFGAEEALRLGLVHQVVPPDDLVAAAQAVLSTIVGNSAAAIADAKALIRAVEGRPFDAALRRETAERIARARATADAQARLAAFLARRGTERSNRT